MMNDFLYSLDWGVPTPTEYRNNAEYQKAVKAARPVTTVTLRKYLSGSDAHHWSEIVVWRSEIVPGPAVTPCICCGGAIANSAVSTLGFSAHKRCVAKPVLPEYAEVVAEAFELMAAPVEQKRTWKEVGASLKGHP